MPNNARPSPPPSSAGRLGRRHLIGGLSALGASVGTRARARPVGPKHEYVDNLIIGTGYGGAVAAYRLGRAGRQVLMLEMGRSWLRPGPDGTVFSRLSKPDWRSMWYRDRIAMPLDRFLGLDIVNAKIERGPGVLDRRSLGFMDVYLGRGVGGGSLVNGAMAPRPKRAVIARELPDIDLHRFYKTYLPRAEAHLKVTSIPEDFLESSPWYKFTRTARSTAQSAGYSVVDIPSTYNFDYMRKEARNKVTRSALDGQLIWGNDHGKNDLTRTYLFWADASGAVEIRTGCQAMWIEAQADGRYVVVVQERDFDWKLVRTRTICAKAVYLGAGSIGTTEILLRSKAMDGLKNLSQDVGRHWGPNGNTMFARANHVWHPTGTQQSTIAVMGIDLWDTSTPCLAEISPLPTGLETWCSLYLAVTDNRRRAAFSYDLSQDRLALDWSQKDAEVSVKIAKKAFDKVNRKHGTIYRRDLLSDGEAFSRDFCFHPLGGAVLGRATDGYGRLRGHPGIYVTDGALVPGTLGANPFLTITALAERLMQNVLEHD